MCQYLLRMKFYNAVSADFNIENCSNGISKISFQQISTLKTAQIKYFYIFAADFINDN